MRFFEFSKEPGPERDEGGGGSRFIPWPDFVSTIASLTKNDFIVNQKSSHKTQVRAKFIPLDPYSHGPTMIYASVDTRKTVGGKMRGVGVMCQFQTGTYEKGAHGDPTKVISVFKLPTDPKLKMIEMTYANAVMLADIINGNTAGALMEEDLRKWFKEKWVRFGPDGKIRGDCARGDDSEGKPKCLPQSKAHALGKKKRASAAAKKRREDPNPERKGAAKNVATKVREEQLDEKCWDGYHKEGNKKMFGKTVPNCVKNEGQENCPHCGGLMLPETALNEKKDACYYKVKSRYKVWPSAYASGALVQCRKKGAKNWGKS